MDTDQWGRRSHLAAERRSALNTIDPAASLARPRSFEVLGPGAAPLVSTAELARTVAAGSLCVAGPLELWAWVALIRASAAGRRARRRPRGRPPTPSELALDSIMELLAPERRHSRQHATALPGENKVARRLESTLTMYIHVMLVAARE